MKKLILIIMIVVAMSAGQAFAEDIGTQVESGMKQFFLKRIVSHWVSK